MSTLQEWALGSQKGSGMQAREADPGRYLPSCSCPSLTLLPFSSLPASAPPATSPVQGDFAASSGGQVEQAQSSPGRAGGETRAAPRHPLSPAPRACLLPLLSPPPLLCPSRVFTCFHLASPNFTPTYSHLPGFPSCNQQLLSPPPPGLRDTKGFTHPHRHRHRHRQTDQ